MDPKAPPPIIVIGMHRSGTSLVTKILSELGVHIGTELDNHYESKCFKNINRRLLQAQGAYWAQPEPFVSQLDDEGFVRENADQALSLWEQWRDGYGPVEEGRSWAWKDPRNTLTLPIWLRIFPEAKVIHVVRNGIDVALSLCRRETRNLILRYRQPRASRYKLVFPPTVARGYRLWARYVQLGLGLEAGCAHWLSLRYEDVISQPQSHLTALSQFSGIAVASKARADLARRVIRQPARRSTLDVMRVRFLFRVGLIDPNSLLALGYKEAW